MVALTSNLDYKKKESVSETFCLPSVELGSLPLSFSDRDFFGFFAMRFLDNAV